MAEFLLNCPVKERTFFTRSIQVAPAFYDQYGEIGGWLIFWLSLFDEDISSYEEEIAWRKWGD